MIECFVNVNNKRYFLIEKMVSVISDDLGLKDVSVHVLSFKEMDGSDGVCFGSDQIDIVNKRDERKLFKVIAHELKHIQQHKTGVLDENVWYGEVIDEEKYNDLPWEVEACEYEKYAIENLFKKA